VGIIVTFLFSDSSESDVLWVKLNVERLIVNKWIIVEGTFSHKGTYKGSCLRDVLNESRFLEFADRIEIVTCNQNLLMLFHEQKRMARLSWTKQILRLFGRKVKESIKSVLIFMSLGLTGMKLDRKESLKRQIEREYHEAEKQLRNQAKEIICKIASPEDWIFVCDVDEVLDGETLGIKDFSLNYPQMLLVSRV